MALPSSGSISLRQIGDYLGAYDLLSYRGSVYYRGSTPVTISQTPSLQEFYGLSRAPVLNNADMYQFSLEAPNPNALIQIVYYPTNMNVGVHSANGVILTYGPAAIMGFNPADYTNFQFSYRVVGGCCVNYFGVAEGQGGDSGGRNILQWNFNQGSNINIIATVTATPK